MGKKNCLKISPMPARKPAEVKPSWAAELGSFPHDAVWQHFHLGEHVPPPPDWSQRWASWRPAAHAWEFRVVLTLDSRRSERWKWQHTTRVCCLQTHEDWHSCSVNKADGVFDLQVFIPYLILIWNDLNMWNLGAGSTFGSTFFNSCAFFDQLENRLTREELRGPNWG